jgi:peptidoglycan/LPS O-acetylase OafA/YrhL
VSANNKLLSFGQFVLKPLRDTTIESFQTRYYPLGYVPALDGMRGLMSIGVVVAHAYFSIIPGTVLYMDVFFVASAYYITSLLIRDIERHRQVRYVDFYKRRFFRIVPPVLLMLTGYLVYHLFFGSLPFVTASKHAAIVLSYTSNWWYIFDPKGIEDLGHTWTLSVEEQFYLLWPVTFAFLVRRVGVTWRLVAATCIIGAAIWAWRIFLTYGGAEWPRLYCGLDTRIDDLMAGSAMAVALKLMPSGRYPAIDRFLPKLAWPLAIYWPLITVFFWKNGGDGNYRYYYYFASVVCGVIPAIAALTMLIRSSGTICHRVLELPGAVFLGRIFYSIYLWHFPIMTTMESYGVTAKFRVLFVVPLSIVISTLSYAYVERHFMRHRTGRLPEPASPVTSTLATSQ